MKTIIEMFSTETWRLMCKEDEVLMEKIADLPEKIELPEEKDNNATE